MTGNTIRMRGAIDRADPDPARPHDPFRQHIGWITVCWRDDRGDASTQLGALLRDYSGRTSSGSSWGPSVLCIVWIGDPPPADVAQAAHDWIVDRGPARGELEAQLEAMQRSEAAPSYRVAS